MTNEFITPLPVRLRTMAGADTTPWDMSIVMRSAANRIEELTRLVDLTNAKLAQMYRELNKDDKSQAG